MRKQGHWQLVILDNIVYSQKIPRMSCMDWVHPAPEHKNY